MKISKLLLDNFLYNYERDCMRQTGKSTAQALRVISESMGNPGIPIKCIDYSMPPIFNTHAKNRYFLDMISKIIFKLELKYLTININDLTLTYNIMLEI